MITAYNFITDFTYSYTSFFEHKTNRDFLVLLFFPLPLFFLAFFLCPWFFRFWPSVVMSKISRLAMETAAMGMMGYPFLAPSPIMKATIHWPLTGHFCCFEWRNERKEWRDEKKKWKKQTLRWRRKKEGRYITLHNTRQEESRSDTSQQKRVARKQKLLKTKEASLSLEE